MKALPCDIYGDSFPLFYWRSKVMPAFCSFLYEKSPNARTTCGSIARSWSIVSSATLDARRTPTAAKLKVMLFSDAPLGLPKGGS
jgi:hypothetical protein